MMRSGAIRAAAALVVFLAVAPALPQTLPTGKTALEPPDVQRFLRWGPLRVRPALVIPGLGYDDNVFYATGTEEKVGDAYITLSPRVDGVILLGKQAFATFVGRYDYTAYSSYSAVNYSNSYTAARITVPFERVGVYFEGGHDRIQDRPEDLQDARPERRERRAGAGVIVKAGWRTEAEFGFLASRWRATDPNYLSCRGPVGEVSCFTIGDLLDRKEEGRRFQIKYLAVGRTRLTLATSSKDIDFENDDPLIARDAKERRFVPGVELGAGGPVTGVFRLGNARLDLFRTEVVDFDGPVGEAAIAWRGGSDTTIRFAARRDVFFSIYEDNNVYVRGWVEGRVVKYFNRMLGAEAGAVAGRLRFPQGERVDNQNSVDVGLRVRLSENALGRRVEYSLRYVRYRVDSNRDTLDQSRSTLAFGASLGY